MTNEPPWLNQPGTLRSICLQAAGKKPAPSQRLLQKRRLLRQQQFRVDGFGDLEGVGGGGGFGEESGEDGALSGAELLDTGDVQCANVA